ncbi:hypothetical protein SASPL_124419 [Salvia splendens]|uniref:Uncharacterized protein n=1 Tax=Salvia splendens TaxID=180675 RepID=A0A8X8XNH0_SALSN|nr:hypothetical protein SASPL_124419 [Salvia splendens]
MILPVKFIMNKDKTKILKKHHGDRKAPIIGSLSTLYNGLANLDTFHFSTEDLRTCCLIQKALMQPSILDLIGPSLKLELPSSSMMALLRMMFVSRKPLTALLCGHQCTRTARQANAAWIVLYGYELMTTEAKDLLFKPPSFDDASCNEMDAQFGCCNDYLALSFDRSKTRCHVRGSGMYMVSDNLRVTPLSVSSGVSVINEMKGRLVGCGRSGAPSRVGRECLRQREKTKVLFAEAGSDFIDVLLCFLLLPLGTIMEVLEKHYGDKAPVVGSLIHSLQRLNIRGSIIETLSTIGVSVKDMDGMDIRNVTFGLNEIIALLKESLISSNPLTALIFPVER